MNHTPASEKLSNKTKVLYGFADLGIQTLVASIQFWLLFYYTDVARRPGDCRNSHDGR